MSQNAVGDELRFIFKAIVGLVLGLQNIYDFLNEILYFTEPLCMKDQGFKILEASRNPEFFPWRCPRQAGWVSEQPGLVDSVPAHGTG